MIWTATVTTPVVRTAVMPLVLHVVSGPESIQRQQCCGLKRQSGPVRRVRVSGRKTAPTSAVVPLQGAGVSQMNAKEFNRKYEVGTCFIRQSHQASGPVVRTVGKANDFKCGVIVEINVIPYFVRIDTLIPAM